MTRRNERRARLGMTWFALALGALALLAMPSLAAAKDRNHDRIPDRWEKRHHLSLRVNQEHRDQDGDHLRNRAEFLAGDNPRDEDSDDDGVMDGAEQAGTIASFDQESGKLVITLFGGETLSGLVNEETEIKCEHEHPSSASTSCESEPGDDHGGEAEPSDDNGGQGEEEPGDDSGGDNSGPGSQNSGPGRGDDEGDAGNCTTADLLPGAVVQEAEVHASGGQATFEEVELSGRDA
jgi:hypothetical protein